MVHIPTKTKICSTRLVVCAHTSGLRGHHLILVASHGSAQTPLNATNEGNVKTDHGARWLASPEVRSTRTGSGAVVLNTKNGLYYRLKPGAARVWVVIEGSPTGIGFEGIVDVLETHFTVSREELDRNARNCLAELQLAGLVRRRVAAGR